MRWGTLAIRADETVDAPAPEVRKPRRRGLGPAVQGLVAFAIYLDVFVLAFCLALVGHASVPVVGQVEVDPNFYIWAWHWWTYAVSHWTNPLYTFQLNAPGGYNLAWATTSPTVALLMWPFTAWLGPVVAFNLSLILAPAGSAWAAFVLTRRLTGRFWASLPAGAVYGFNVYMLDHEVSGQPNLTVTLLVPLMAYLVVRWWDESLGTAGYVIWMMIALAAEFYTFIEAYAQVTLLLVPAFLIGFLICGRQALGRVFRLCLSTILAYVGGVLLAAPYLLYALKHYPTELTRQEPQFSLDVSGLILPRLDRLLGQHWLAASAGHDTSATSYMGVPLLALLVLLAVLRWRSRLNWLLLTGFIIVIGLAAGPNLIVDGRSLFGLPWGGLWSLPIAKSAEAVRLVVFGYLILAVALAQWLALLTRNWLVRVARWSLGLLAVAAIFADLPTFAEVAVPPAPRGWSTAASLPLTNTIPAFFTDGTYKKYIRPGEIVAVVSRRGNAGMLFQASTDFYFRIDGGFINASLSRPDALPAYFELMAYPNQARFQAFEDYIRAEGVGAIVVEQAWSELWMYNFGQLGMTAVSGGGVTLYQTSEMIPAPLYRAGAHLLPAPLWSLG